MRNFLSEILAVANSRKISAFLDGVNAALPDGEIIFIKVKNTERVQRTQGLRFSKFSYVTEIEAGGETGFGYGESDSQLVSFQKSIVEGIERSIYRIMKARSSGFLTSNGWAAHVNDERANLSALEELCERDAILSHWFCQKPFIEIDLLTCPAWIVSWAKQELCNHPQFNRLRVLTTTIGHVPVVMTIFQSEDGRAVMSQASAPRLEEAVYKALGETCRIGEIAGAGRFKNSSGNLAQDLPSEERYAPEDHAMVYAYHLPVPEWLFGSSKSWQECRSHWNNEYRLFRSKLIPATFHKIISGPIVVGYCTSEQIQNLFFGRTMDAKNNGLLNLSRLENLKLTGSLYLLPHCVP